MTKVGVVLSGCGMYDGSEIHEATLTLFFLDRAGAEVTCMAPDIRQVEAIDHVTGKPTGEERDVLLEAARIARGSIRDIAQVRASDLVALILAGGLGGS